MSNSYPRRKSIALAGNARVYRTFEDWQAEQQLDQRTPAERGISVGSLVMWRHRDGNVIVTDHATVTAISQNTLTLLVKDVRARTCKVDIREIVNHALAHLTLAEASQGVAIASPSGNAQASGQTTSTSSSPSQASLTEVMDTATRRPWRSSTKARSASV